LAQEPILPPRDKAAIKSALEAIPSTSDGHSAYSIRGNQIVVRLFSDNAVSLERYVDYVREQLEPIAQRYHLRTEEGLSPTQELVYDFHLSLNSSYTF